MYLLGQRKEGGSNPGLAICLEWIYYRINFLGGRGTV